MCVEYDWFNNISRHLGSAPVCPEAPEVGNTLTRFAVYYRAQLVRSSTDSTRGLFGVGHNRHQRSSAAAKLGNLQRK